MARVAHVILLLAGLCVAFSPSVQAGKSGIWKPGDGSNNFYIQTYSTGSCVVIVTPDGADFHVFLDPLCDDRVVGLEYFGRSATLDLTFLPDNTATADLVIESESTEYTLDKIFEGDCRNGDETTETITNSLGMTFVYIPPGRFTMGSPLSELGRGEDETQHLVTLTQGFYMQTTKVTQGQWTAVMGSNPSSFDTCGDDCPVEQISWEDVQSFIAALNALGEGTYRLPTEAEWEYAARAGSDMALTNGDITQEECGLDANLEDMGWYCYNAGGTTHPVGRKTANAWALYDMHGNVYEWCQDRYGEYPTGPQTNPTGPSSGSYRVRRGGSWSQGAKYCRSAIRSAIPPDARTNYIGARLLRVAP